MELPSLQVPLERRILSIRGQRVLLDSDVAWVYGVTTKRLNQQFRRNRQRFPEDFVFQLTALEKREVVANCDHLKQLRFSPALPYAFTEHGAIMLASVLNSQQAIVASVQVVRAFVRLKEMTAGYERFVRRIDELEDRCDRRFKVVFDAIRGLRERPAKTVKKIGFQP